MKKCLVCGSENSDESTVCSNCKKPLQTTKRKSIELPIIYGVIILAILGVFLSRGIWGPLMRGLRMMPPRAQMKITYNWAKTDIGNTGLSIDSPVELKLKFIKLPENVKPLIREMVTYGFSSFPLSVDAVSVVYSEKVVPNLQGAEQGAIANFKRLKFVNNVQYNPRPFSASGKNGTLLDGTFEAGKNKMGFKAAILLENVTMWQVVVVYNTQDPQASEAANRIINSINIAKK